MRGELAAAADGSVMNKSSPRLFWLNLLLVTILSGFFAFLLYRLFFALNYNWNWSIIPQYLFFFDEAEGRWKANLLMQGLFTTIRLSIWATLLATVFGFVAGVLRTTPRLFNRLVGRSYVELIRNVPPLVLIFLFYFFYSVIFL